MHPQHHPLRLLSRPNFHSYTQQRPSQGPSFITLSFHGLFEAVIQQLHPTAAFPRAVIHHPQLLRPYQRRHSSPSASRPTIKPTIPSASQPPSLFEGPIFTSTLSSNLCSCFPKKYLPANIFLKGKRVPQQNILHQVKVYIIFTVRNVKL